MNTSQIKLPASRQTAGDGGNILGKKTEAVTAQSDKMGSSQLDVAVWKRRKNPAVETEKQSVTFVK